MLIEPVNVRWVPLPLVFGKITSLTMEKNDPLPSRPLKLAPQAEAGIVQMRNEHPTWGAPKIR